MPRQARGPDLAISADGQILPYTPVQVRGIVQDAIATGELIAVILRKDDSLMVQVLGPPSRALADELDQAAMAYRHAIRGH